MWFRPNRCRSVTILLALNTIIQDQQHFFAEHSDVSVVLTSDLLDMKCFVLLDICVKSNCNHRMNYWVVACNVFFEVTSFSHSRHLYQSCRNSLDVLLRRHSNENMMIITIGKLIQLILIETFNVFCYLFLFSLWLYFALQTNLALFYSSVPLSSFGGSGEQQEASNNTAIFFGLYINWVSVYVSTRFFCCFLLSIWEIWIILR